MPTDNHDYNSYDELLSQLDDDDTQPAQEPFDGIDEPAVSDPFVGAGSDASLSFDLPDYSVRHEIHIPGTDTVFNVRPIGTKEYIAMLKRKKTIALVKDVNNASPKDQLRAMEIMDNLIIPLVEPNEEFRAWCKVWRNKNLFAYRRNMDNLANWIFSGFTEA